MRVLVVEDDEGIAVGLRATLRQHGMVVDVVGTLEAAWAALRSEAFDLVLLDLGLPDGDGGDLLTRLRTGPVDQLPDPLTPVLIMTARDQVGSRIAGLDMGADDYVVKPFDAQELAARMRALQRRARGRAHAVLTCGELEIDTVARRVGRRGQPVELSAREYALLLSLVNVRPRVLSRAQIEAQLYSFEQVLDSNAIEVHVHHLRRKLGEGVIRTMRGVGYFVPADPTP